jgi:hypothetical protein
MQTLQVIYYLYVKQGGQRTPVLERLMSYKEEEFVFSQDFLRNEPEMYKLLFSVECESCIKGVYEKLFAEMKGLAFMEAGGVIGGLSFLQYVGATALWRFNCDLDCELESFVRGFDRLDLAVEKERLYMLAQS